MHAAPAPAGAGRAWWWGALLLVAARLVFSAVMPITGDEAYFYYWGLMPAAGYYDHPPMVGWWLSLLIPIADHEGFIRLPATLLPVFCAAVAYRLVGDGATAGDAGAAARAPWVALIVLLAPVGVWNVFITTDTPLIAFSLLAAAAYVTAMRRRGRAALAWNAAAGVFLGLAFLSKYFAGFLAIACVAHLVVVRRDPGRWAALLVLAAAALPGPLFNFWWNSGNCWVNLLFNLFNRHDGGGFRWNTAPLYLLTLAYVLSPFALAAAVRHRRELIAGLRARPEAAALVFLAGLPFALFALLSPVKTIGLHWLLSFVPLCLAGLAMALPQAALPRLAAWLAGFALVHVLAIAVVLALPLSTWSSTRIHDGLVLTFRSEALIARLAPFAADHAFASDGYSNAVTLGYNARRYFMVFGPGSSHARHDDILTDFRRHDGRNIAILRKTRPEPGEYSPYFERVVEESFEVDGARFTLIRGQGFRYAVYRDRQLAAIRDRWYRIPAWLPTTACDFCDRYFPGQAYPRR